MTHAFDEGYWDEHWRAGGAAGPANPYLLRETAGLPPGTALDAGCGAGAEAIWLASHGWQVSGADIAAGALELAAARAAASGVTPQVRWIRADLSRWEPSRTYDLVTTHYAHPAMPQLDFYDRISDWVAPGGTLFIVGHLSHDHDHHAGPAGTTPPPSASVTAADITARLAATEWEVVTAEEPGRIVTGHDGAAVRLHDVVVRATRRP